MLEISNYELIRIFVALSMLSIASFLDIKKREIHDLLWIVFGIVAGILLFFEGDIFNELKITGFSLIIAPLALIAWRIGLFGGADAFALIVLAAISPLTTIIGTNVTPFTTLTNAAILSVVPLMINVFRNLIALRKDNIFDGFDETKIKKMYAMFIGHKAKIPKFSFTIEKKVGKIKKFDLSLRHAETTEFCTQPDTWITPGIPYLLLIFGGYIVQLFYGDILMRFFTSLS